MTMIPNAKRFYGKTAIVTGAGSGIGRATAIQLAEEGAKVICVEIIKERLDQLLAEKPELKFIPVEGDVTKNDTIIKSMEATGGKLDILINNAGINDGFQSVAEMDDDIWNRVFEVNLVAYMKMMRAAIPLMIKNGKGAIVNIASEAALRGSPAGVAYVSSKHAVVGLTKSTALFHFADGIRTNAVAPGGVNTNIDVNYASELFADRLGNYIGNMPRMAQPEELAAGICFLASDEASNFNGVILPCDGGWSAV